VFAVTSQLRIRSATHFTEMLTSPSRESEGRTGDVPRINWHLALEKEIGQYSAPITFAPGIWLLGTLGSCMGPTAIKEE
jgi:hypothetical protein